MKNRGRINSGPPDSHGFLFFKFIRKNLFSSVTARVLFFILLFLPFAEAQDSPKEIRGYKVYKAKISVKNQSDKSGAKDDSEVFVKVGAPKVTDISLTGVTLETSPEIVSSEQSGTIDFVTFKDFRVNDLKVEVEDYKNSFEIKKNQPVILPKPIIIFINAGQTLRGALSEWRDSKSEWTITGTVFIFGRFKKFGFNFKRVVPVEVNLKIKNPLSGVSDEEKQ